MANVNMPRPTPFMIAQNIQSGLKIPSIQIDPRLNFVRGAFIFASDIDKFGLAFKSFKEPLIAARDLVVIPSIKENFDQQGRPKWKSLTKKTVYNRLIEGYPRGPILQKTGKLKTAATRKNIWDFISAVGRDGVDMLQMRTVYFDQLVPYAEFLQLGTRAPTVHTTRGLSANIGRTGNVYSTGHGAQVGSFKMTSKKELYSGKGGKIPPRPFIMLTMDDEVAIYGIFESFLTKKVAEHWGSKEAGL